MARLIRTIDLYLAGLQRPRAHAKFGGFDCLMFKWLRSLWMSAGSPSKPFVSFDDIAVTWHRPDNTVEEVTWDELTAMEIVTTDEGPFVCDVFFLLHGDQRGCAIPQDAEGAEELLKRLQKLPGFNNQAVIDAMCCTSNARIPVWQRDKLSGA
jgi:hypothetical protein